MAKQFGKKTGAKGNIKANSKAAPKKKAKAAPAEDEDDEDDEDEDADEAPAAKKPSTKKAPEPADDDDDINFDDDDDDADDGDDEDEGESDDDDADDSDDDDSDDSDDDDSDDGDDNDDDDVDLGEDDGFGDNGGKIGFDDIDEEDTKPKSMLVANGMYHVELEAYKYMPGGGMTRDNKEKMPSVELKLRVIGGETKAEDDDINDQLNKVVNHYVYLDGRDAEAKKTTKAILARTLIAFGPWTMAKLKQVGASEKSFEKCLKRQAIIKVVNKEFNGDMRSQLSYMGIWNVNDEEVLDVPCNKKALKRIGITRAERPDDDA